MGTSRSFVYVSEVDILSKQNTVAVVTALIEPIIEKFGLELWDVRFEKEGSSWFLRIFIDKDGGIGIDDCENVSRAVDPLLDEADPIENSYILEVSSPGIERELVKDSHFLKYIGEPVHVRFIRPVNGERDFIGILKEYDNGSCTVELSEDSTVNFSLNETSFVKLYYDFGGTEENE